ncbi:glycerophosphodiester phosphodiesterase family protein [Algibacter sp. 2305UL17-15]|uniref:glycerophosphodiester phosphodiesterase n=1 Tax=Algibacter sp. 2305UL17-15 TaxID=3231268 RepID=UPI003459F0D3
MKKAFYKLLAFILICFIYVCLSLSPIFFKDFSNEENTHKTKIIAHRGASSFAPENTLASIQAALNQNPDRIEIDVQQTSDKVVVLMHDTSLDRTTNGTGLIKEKTFKDLSKLDAGSWFSNEFKDERIPTLEAAIQLINGKCQLIIEIKKGSSYYPNIEKNILNSIQKYNAEDWVIIHSFDDTVLETVHALNPKIPLHKLFVGKFKFSPFIYSNSFDRLDLKKYNYIDEYSINYVFANREIIDILKSNGKKVNVWTVDNSETARELTALGVDGIITNNPKLLDE